MRQESTWSDGCGIFDLKVLLFYFSWCHLQVMACMWGLSKVLAPSEDWWGSPQLSKKREEKDFNENISFFYQKRKICYINNNFFFLINSRKLYSKEALKKWLTELQYRQTHPHTKGPKQQGKHKKTFSLIANTPNL